MPHFRLSFTMSMASAASRVAEESTEHLKIAYLRCGRQLPPNIIEPLLAEMQCCSAKQRNPEPLTVQHSTAEEQTSTLENYLFHTFGDLCVTIFAIIGF